VRADPGSHDGDGANWTAVRRETTWVARPLLLSSQFKGTIWVDARGAAVELLIFRAISGRLLPHGVDEVS
jgi:hypothetical protein